MLLSLQHNMGEFEVNSSVFPHSWTDILEFHFYNCSSLEINVLWPLLGILPSKAKHLQFKRIGVFLDMCFCGPWAFIASVNIMAYDVETHAMCCADLIQCMGKCCYWPICLLNQFFTCSERMLPLSNLYWR